MNRFFETRINALEYWIEGTHRVIADKYSGLTNDDYSGSFECQWQNKSECGHVSIFCSVGEWASNITDILREESLDKYFFKKEDEGRKLFRYYTRLLLVVSEMLTDFQDMYLQANELKSNAVNNDTARKFLFPIKEILHLTNPIQEMFDFVNKICKHKTKNIHKCNHHLPLVFSDNKSEFYDTNCLIHLQNLDFTTPKQGILVPTLRQILYTVITCYKSMDEHFNDPDSNGFKKICELFSR